MYILWIWLHAFYKGIALVSVQTRLPHNFQSYKLAFSPCYLRSQGSLSGVEWCLRKEILVYPLSAHNVKMIYFYYNPCYLSESYVKKKNKRTIKIKTWRKNRKKRKEGKEEKRKRNPNLESSNVNYKVK